MLPGVKRNRNWDHEDFKAACVSFHNFLRVVHNAAPLKWDDTLEQVSQAWAQHLNVIQSGEEHYKGAKEIGTNIYQQTAKVESCASNDELLLILKRISLLYYTVCPLLIHFVLKPGSHLS